jgi:2-amino-4-hydroxy-6-hydroxymethyldihydropteridine diphosphokinase
MEIGFSLGSNLGDRLAHLTAARQRILAEPSTTLSACAAVYETEPVGVSDPFRDLLFLNTVLIVETNLTAPAWLALVGRIEDDLGRVRTHDRNAPRTIDIDILYAGDQYIDDGGLTVPHPRWAARLFVVQPLAEVRPDLVLQDAGKPVSEVLLDLAESKGIALFAEDW